MKFSTATELLTSLGERGFVQSLPINVDEIAQRLGINVVYDVTLQDRDITGLIEFSDSGAIVRLNPYQNDYEPRRRFTLAHEIGHFCLHSNSDRSGFVDYKKTMSRSSSYWDVHESQANSFAAHLLMPADLVAREGSQVLSSYQTTNGNTGGMPVKSFIEAMAVRFWVSNPAMEYRLKAMGVLK